MVPDLRSHTGHGLGVPLVAGAAVIWGSDALFRRGLALDLPASTVVFYEHIVLFGLTFRWLVRSRAAVAHLKVGDWAALIAVGAGASAAGTFLFTAAFSYGDPNTPLLLQKLQPLIAVLGARIILGERLLPRYWFFFVVSVLGAFLIAFPDPTELTTPRLAPAAFAIGAAALWGMGTVLGRRLSSQLDFKDLTAWRFAIGLPASWAIWALQTNSTVSSLTGNRLLAVGLLAIVPGLAAMMIYYRGLALVPASSATLAELAFPVSATAINYLVFDAILTSTQWVGLGALVATITLMGILGAREIRLTRVGVEPALAGGR